MDAKRAEPRPLLAAYHAGPPAIAFFGMDWTRGRAQEITPMQWQGMQLRGDFKEFDFRVEGASQSPSPLAPLPEGEGKF